VKLAGLKNSFFFFHFGGHASFLKKVESLFDAPLGKSGKKKFPIIFEFLEKQAIIELEISEIAAAAASDKQFLTKSFVLFNQKNFGFISGRRASCH